MSEELTIGELVKQTRLRHSALRYYESIGLLTPERRVSGQRRYLPEAVRRLKLIQLAQMMGFSLDEIHILLDGFPESTPPALRWRAITPQKLAEIDLLIRRVEQIKGMLESTLRCECESLEDCPALCDSLSETP